VPRLKQEPLEISDNSDERDCRMRFLGLFIFLIWMYLGLNVNHFCF
jgi:hypothetical protein